MPWDAQRPVPWSRLVKEWALFAAVMALVFALFAGASVASYLGLLASLPLYLALGAFLSKFGYERKSLRTLRAERAAQAAAATETAAAPGPRPKPAPTKRTSTGPQRSSKQRKR